MKITKNKLKRIIKEELENVLKEVYISGQEARSSRRQPESSRAQELSRVHQKGGEIEKVIVNIWREKYHPLRNASEELKRLIEVATDEQVVKANNCAEVKTGQYLTTPTKAVSHGSFLLTDPELERSKRGPSWPPRSGPESPYIGPPGARPGPSPRAPKKALYTTMESCLHNILVKEQPPSKATDIG